MIVAEIGGVGLLGVDVPLAREDTLAARTLEAETDAPNSRKKVDESETLSRDEAESIGFFGNIRRSSRMARPTMAGGGTLPFSHLDTVFASTPSSSASSFC